MKEKKTYDAIDIAKLISALLVVSIHTFPFIDINENANFILVSIIARLAVPFFFITSGYFFFRKLDFHKKWNDKENIQKWKHYVWRLFKLYIIWSVIYLPYNFVLLHNKGFVWTDIIRYIRDFLFTGSFYHLWFLPALLFAVSMVYLLVFQIGMKKTLFISLILYIIGMLGNIYQPFINTIPGISSVFHMYIQIFGTTRNGLFFGMIFIALGCYVARYKVPMEANQLSLYTGIGIILLVIECVTLKINGLIQDLSSMYLMLVPCVLFIFIRLLRVEMKHRPMYGTFRVLSLLIYVSHMLFAQLFIWMIPDMNSFLFYVLTIGCSFLFSYLIYHLSKHYTLLKQLY